MKAQTYTWVILPEGKRIKKILPLDERLQPYPARFIEKFGVAPKFVFMRTEMAKDWKGDFVLEMEIIKLNRNYPIHTYSFAVTKEDFLGETNNGSHGVDRTSNHSNSERS